jgi:hypothetical protein
MTGDTRLVSLSNLYIEIGWEKLKDRRERHRKIQFYKMSNNLTPQYLSNLICLFQLPSSESCSPRCLCSVTVLMIVLFIIRLG